MNARAWGKLTLGVVLIGGILAGLWAMYGPRTAGPPDDPQPRSLASTRTALLAGPGCPRLVPGQVGIAARGRFGARRFAHRAVRGGCPDPDGWLAVDALASPVIVPDRELKPARQAGSGGTAGGGSISP